MLIDDSCAHVDSKPNAMSHRYVESQNYARCPIDAPDPCQLSKMQSNLEDGRPLQHPKRHAAYSIYTFFLLRGYLSMFSVLALVDAAHYFAFLAESLLVMFVLSPDPPAGTVLSVVLPSARHHEPCRP